MNKKLRNVFWGVLLIAIAVFWLVGGLGYLQGVDTSHIVFSIIWGAWLIKGIFDREEFSIFMSLAFLAIVWDKELGIEAITPWPVIGAAILFTIGFSMLFKNSKRKKWENKYSRGDSMNDENVTWEGNTKYGTDYAHQSHVDGEHVFHMNRFSGAQKYVDSQNLKSVEIINKAGGIEVYLDKAKAAGDTIQMRVECLAGGMEIYIPRSWNVVNNVNCFAGAVEIQGKQVNNQAVNDINLVLTGTVKAAGIEVIRV